MRAHPTQILVMGALTAAFQLLFFAAVPAAGVSVATVAALGTAPVLLLLLHSVDLRRVPGTAQLITVSSGDAGLLLISLIGGDTDASAPDAGGDRCTRFRCRIRAFPRKWAAPSPRATTPVPVATGTTGAAALTMVPAGLTVGLVGGDSLVAADTATWAGLASLGVVTMALA